MATNSPGCFQRDLIALAHRERGQLAEFAEAVAQRVDLMATSDHQPVLDHYRPMMAAIEAGKHVYCE
jgi:predicted dehydrogenase